jgi:phosphoribosylanthranilate isomerase
VRVRMKICGLTRNQDARSAVVAGASFGGVILAPGSRRTVSPGSVPAIFAGTDLVRCGVFVNEGAERIRRLAAEMDLGVLQLHGDETPEFAADLRSTTGVTVWKAIRPRSGGEFAAAAEGYDGAVDGLLLDGWSASARGGTGARFPWREVARHRERLEPSLTLVVAGGLTAENVAEVITLLSPDIVDVSSGVEASPGVKDPQRIQAFADAVRGAVAERGV